MILYLLGVPLLVMWLATKWKWIDAVSPMTVLYVIGLLVGNLLPISKDAIDIDTMAGNIAIPLAIPLMLMGCNLKSWSTAKAVKVFASGLLAVMIVSVVGFYLFRGSNDHGEMAQVAAVSLGMYTGGIPNVGAIAKGVGMGQELYLYLTSYDLIATGLYLVFVVFCGKTVFRKLLPNKALQQATPTDALSHKITAAGVAVENIGKKDWRPLAFTLGLTIAIAAVSYLLSTMVLPASDGGTNMTVLILSLTTLSIAATFLKPVQRQTQSFDIGLYCVYVFSLSIATACNVRDMDLMGSLNVLYYVMFVIFGSLVMQILFAKLLKIDGDSVLVCSVSLINSPPFVPMVAALLGNKDIVVLGITVGLLGYMLGNYLGIGLFFALS